MYPINKVPNLVLTWDGPVCWGDFENCADSIEEAAQDIYDQEGYTEGHLYIVQCCEKKPPVVPHFLADDIIEKIDNDEDNSLASGDGIMNTLTKEQRAELQTLIEHWVLGTGITSYRWTEFEQEIDITELVKAQATTD